MHDAPREAGRRERLLHPRELPLVEGEEVVVARCSLASRRPPPVQPRVQPPPCSIVRSPTSPAATAHCAAFPAVAHLAQPPNWYHSRWPPCRRRCRPPKKAARGPVRGGHGEAISVALDGERGARTREAVAARVRGDPHLILDVLAAVPVAHLERREPSEPTTQMLVPE